jgi:hypothetical protein
LTRHAFANDEAARQAMIKTLDTPTRVVLCVSPEHSFSYDGTKMIRTIAGAAQPNS